MDWISHKIRCFLVAHYLLNRVLKLGYANL